jgi:bacillithiol system protein YtxJ
MSIFNNIFGNSENQNTTESKINWIALTDLDQLDQISEASANKPIVIFKHSTRCSISRMALKQFEREFDSAEAVDAYFLDLIEYRAVSNEIATRFAIQHQSPQLLLIKDAQAVYSVTHSDIDAIELKSKI